MSASPPPKDAEADQADHSGDNDEIMSRDDGQGRDMAFNELDVKEQDRWLPIANGESFSFVFNALFAAVPREHGSSCRPWSHHPLLGDSAGAGPIFVLPQCVGPNGPNASRRSAENLAVTRMRPLPLPGSGPCWPTGAI